MERFFDYARNNATGVHVGLATVTVYAAGTLNVSTIYDDTLNPPTSKGNPFTTDANGFFAFYAANGRYDVKVSGAVPTTYTLADVVLGVADAGVLVTTEAALPTPSSSAQAGRLYKLSDTLRDVRVDTGAQIASVMGSVADVTLFGARGDGSTDDAAAIQAAIDAVGATGGIVQFPRRATAYRFDTALSLNGKQSVSLRGAGGPTGGAAGGVVVRYHGGGAAHALDMTGAVGCALLDLQVLYTSTFTGDLIKHHTNAANNSIERCLLAGSSTANAASLIRLTNSYTVRLLGVAFGGCQVAVLGRTDGESAFANAVQIHDCQFQNTIVVMGVRNPGQAWMITGNTFENLASGAAGAIGYGGSQASNGLFVAGNWCGDATIGGTWIDARGNGILIQGNYIASVGAIGVDLSLYSSGSPVVLGNTFEGVTAGVKLPAAGGTLLQDPVIIGNNFTGTTNPILNARNTSAVGVIILGNTLSGGGINAQVRNLIMPRPESFPTVPDNLGSAVFAAMLDGQAIYKFSPNGQVFDFLLGVQGASGDFSIGVRTETTIGAAGGASALPATPSGYAIVYINGVGERKIPYYAV